MNRTPAKLSGAKGEPVFKNYSFLLVDRDADGLRDLKRRFAELGPNLYLAGDSETASTQAERNALHAVFCRWDGEPKWKELMKTYFRRHPFGLFFFFAEPKRMAEAAELIELGATDCLEAPVNPCLVAPAVLEGIRGRRFELSEVDPQFARLQKFLLFRSPVMRKGLSMLPQVAETDYSVLITGNTGTGKEMVARAIHGLSRRKDRPFVALNCGAIQETLIESELFGHEKGAFTGAGARKKGKFEIAHEGTLFLDEIGEMPMKLQVRLLRILEDGALTRVGGERSFPVNVRVLAATRVDLGEAIKSGLFREDLFYRLNILHIHIPDLNDRREDVPLLATYFFHRALREMNRAGPFPHFERDSLRMMSEADWEGNVRQLKNAMTRLAVLLPEDVRRVQPEMISFLTGVQSAEPVRTTVEQVETAQIRESEISGETDSTEDGVLIPFGTKMKDAEKIIMEATLKKNNGNKTKTADMLGISLRNLRRKTNLGF